MGPRKPLPAKPQHANTRRDADKQRVMTLVQQQDWPAASDLCARLCQQRPNDPEAWFLLGAIHGQRNDFVQAAECCRRAIALRPDAVMAHYNLGIALNHLGDYGAAVASFQEAIRLKPSLAEAHHDLGNTYQTTGRLNDAITSYRKALMLQPGLAAAHYNLAHAYRTQDRKIDAIAHLSQALKLNPSYVDARFLLADIFQQQGRFTEAAAQYKEALRLHPENIEAQVSLGNILLELNDIEGAISQYRLALSYRPGTAEVHYNLGNALRTQGHIEEARESYQQALCFNPNFAMACNNLGLTYQQEEKFDTAVGWYQRALAADPTQMQPWLNLARLAREQLRLRDALDALEQIVQRHLDTAEAHWDRALIWLFMGDFARGWEEYEWRWKGGQGIVPRAFNLPRWQGESLDGKTILIYAEQGIGDELMFASCFPDVIARAKHVVIDCAPRLAPLFHRSFSSATIHGGAQNEDTGWLADLPAIDLQIAAGSLPRILRASLGDFPKHSGYLIADPLRVNEWHERYARLGAGLKVGISWRGGHIAHEASKRSTTLDQWQDILMLPGIHWINLQYGKPAQEIADLHERYGIVVHDWDDADPLKDLDNFAAQISALDLVISVDNSTVHMAGALNVPVWVLQPYSPDWRWLLGCEDSHWYPSLRQFRQTTRGDWDAVFRLVQEHLAHYGSRH